MAFRVILLIALSAFIFAGIVLADDALNLTGSEEKTPKAFSKSDAVFVGVLTFPGTLDTKNGAAGYEHYSGLEITVSQIFKGSVSPQIQANLVTVGTQQSVMESPPKKESSYIFFVQRFFVGGRNLIQVQKLLPATDDNIASVKKLIAPIPAK